MNNQDAEDLAANKRAALAGQWRTPPMPVYPTGYRAPASVPTAPPPAPVPEAGLPNPTSIPANSDEYAKALQEAYRKGAEAAARMAQQQQQQQQQQHMPTAASCPDFSAPEHRPTAYPMHATPTSMTDALATSSMPPPPPQHPHMYASNSLPHTRPTTSSQPHPQYSPVAPPLPPPVAASHHAPPLHYASVAAPAPTASTAPPNPPPQGRSISMPDMASYAVQAEEEKRQKRLARNRQSARLRRQRKKNLVEAYETEVGILEKTLRQLKAHEWGASDDHQALLEALGMERGQQAIAPDQRSTIIKDILKHQKEQVQLLQQAQMEQECLLLLASDPEDELSKELEDILQLSPEQKRALQESSQGLEQEIQALETIAASLQAMEENDWLVNEGVAQITDQFSSILHKNQLSKFLLWADANVEAIDQLDHVTVQPLHGAPLFTFGVETAPDNDE